MRASLATLQQGLRVTTDVPGCASARLGSSKCWASSTCSGEPPLPQRRLQSLYPTVTTAVLFPISDFHSTDRSMPEELARALIQLASALLKYYDPLLVLSFLGSLGTVDSRQCPLGIPITWGTRYTYYSIHFGWKETGRVRYHPVRRSKQGGGTRPGVRFCALMPYVV